MSPDDFENVVCTHAAESMWWAFNGYHRKFSRVTRRAGSRFEHRDWHGMQTDARERLDIYARSTQEAVGNLHAILGDTIQRRDQWAAMKSVYARLIADSEQHELAATFFNSLTRRMFSTVGVDPRIEFVQADVHPPVSTRTHKVYLKFSCDQPLAALLEHVLGRYFFLRWARLGEDAATAAAVIERACGQHWHGTSIDSMEVVDAVFYRGQRAYLVGRVRAGRYILPLVLCLVHTEDGLAIDAALVHEDEVSGVFSFTRSYFHVEAPQPSRLVHFLRSMMPRKRVAELYTSLGYNKHGKTELYRDLLRHLERSSDHFEIAPGEPGMVMLVFTLPSYDVVFKIIRDRFSPPKNTTRQAVMDKYKLVFTHDRAGRLVDAQEFEHISFKRSRFSAELLDELQREASGTVTVDADRVHIRHLYTERRITPLNLYLRQADDHACRAAIIDYGRALKDLACSNIFAGDLLLKNFGVTRHGRVIFYDYDELCLLQDCRFRDMPVATTLEDEMSAEPWFYVGPDDIFPEEFSRFLGLDAELLETFMTHHADLLEAEPWRRMQARLAAGEATDIQPYPEHCRLGRRRISLDGDLQQPLPGG